MPLDISTPVALDETVQMVSTGSAALVTLDVEHFEHVYQIAENDGNSGAWLEAVVAVQHTLHLRVSCFDVRLLSGLSGLQ